MGYFKSKELGIETPEAGNSPAITGDLKKLGEQLDTLLRKQLTKLVELAKLKVTETIELPGESITTAMLKALGVTTPKIGEAAVTGPKLGEGTVRQETGSVQSFLSWGAINEAGAVIAGTGDFTSAKVGTGAYEIKWNIEKASANYAVILGGHGLEEITNYSSRTTKGFRVMVVGRGSGEEVAQEFSFAVLAAS